jgi:hypothetical protein
MSDSNRHKRTGYSGKFLTAREYPPMPEKDFIPISKNKLIDVYDSLLKSGRFQKEDMEWNSEGSLFTIPINYLSRYKFGLSDAEIELIVEKAPGDGLEFISGVTFDQDGILISSTFKTENIFRKEDLVLATKLAHGFNHGNRICTMRINAREGITFDILTYCDLNYAPESITDLCYLQGKIVNSFIKLILTKNKKELSENDVSNVLRSHLDLQPGTRLTLTPSSEVYLTDDLNLLKKQFEDNGYLSCISKDNQAVVIKAEVETRKSKFEVTLFISLTNWPKTISMYCNALELNEEHVEGLKIHLGYGSSMVYYCNQSIEFVDKALGASTYLYVPETSIENGLVLKNAELLLGFIEYHLDFLEQGIK